MIQNDGKKLLGKQFKVEQNRGMEHNECQCGYIQIINILSKMEASNAKWRSFHQSAKNIAQSPDIFPARFRSPSKDFSNSDNIPKSINSLGNLLLSAAGKQKAAQQAKPIEYYQVVNKENIRKVDNYQRDPCHLRKQLAKIGENRPQDKAVIDSAISLIHTYEQKIRSLQEQLAKHHKATCKQDLNIKEIQLVNQEGKENSSKKCLGSEKTVSSIPSDRRITDVKTTCVSSYYFPASTNGQ